MTDRASHLDDFLSRFKRKPHGCDNLCAICGGVRPNGCVTFCSRKCMSLGYSGKIAGSRIRSVVHCETCSQAFETYGKSRTCKRCRNVARLRRRRCPDGLKNRDEICSRCQSAFRTREGNSLCRLCRERVRCIRRSSDILRVRINNFFGAINNVDSNSR
jgi:hypothetical protein